MADNIRNFDDYRKKIASGDTTEEIDIEIQDPLDFLSASEREEYYRTQHENMDRERESIDKDSEDFYFDDEPLVKEPTITKEEEERLLSEKQEKHVIKEPSSDKKERKAVPPKKEKPSGKNSRKDSRKNKVKETEEDWFDEDGEGAVNPYVIVRIASVLTGIFILIILGMIFKAKIYDVYLKPDPDNVTGEVQVGQMEGYSYTNDKVTTTTELNLRNTPSTASDDFIVLKVPQGTVLDRIAVSDDGTWAQVEYDNKVLYCVMKYVTVNQ